MLGASSVAFSPTQAHMPAIVIKSKQGKSNMVLRAIFHSHLKVAEVIQKYSNND